MIRRVDWRPLDPVRSIKAKLGLLVVTVVGVEVALLWYSLVVAGWRGRYVVLAVVVVALGVTQVLAHGMTSPLRQMTAAARAMAAGRPPPPVRTSSRDEVGDLARAFTAMSADLAGADAQRRELLANVAHELRTPIAAMRAQVENLLDGVRPADPAALREVLAQTERLGVLVDDLLDLARAEAGATRLDRRPVELGPLVDDVVREVAAARPGPAVRVLVPAGLVVQADPARLRQVLVNLLDNASRHARARVEVTGRAGAHGGVTVEVDDDGPGIAEQDRVAVFERFRRGAVDSGRVDGGRIDGGTGLGLAIARWAVELHGGRIAVVPSATGCRIRVDLPDADLGYPSSAHQPGARDDQ